MTKNDDPLLQVTDLKLALALLSRLPVKANDTSRGPNAAWAYPLVGLVIGGLSGLGGLIALWFGLPAPLVALISLTLLVVLTGAMHEDGLADTADGLWGGWDRTNRLKIMKDSHIGSYGVIALILALAARWAALWALYEAGAGHAVAALVASSILSRAAMPVLMNALPHARDSGLSHSVGSVSLPTAASGVMVALVLALILLGSAFFWAVVWTALAVMAVGAIAKAKIGGQTGDILGATQQVAEIAVLLSLVA